MTSDVWNGWPQGAEERGWHWLMPKIGKQEPEPHEWLGENEDSLGAWNTICGGPDRCAEQYRYLGVALTPAEIARLLSEIERKDAALRLMERTAAMSAEIMLDTARTGSWSGAVRVAGAFTRLANKARAALAPVSP